MLSALTSIIIVVLSVFLIVRSSPFLALSIDFFVRSRALAYRFLALIRLLVLRVFFYYIVCLRCVMLFKFHYEILIATKHFYFLFFRRPFSVSFSYADSFQACFILEIANRCYGFFLNLHLIFLPSS